MDAKPAVEVKPAVQPSSGAGPSSEAAAGPSSSAADTKVELDSELECVVCRDAMVAAHSFAPCGHSFCGECLAGWLEKNHTCPTCRCARQSGLAGSAEQAASAQAACSSVAACCCVYQLEQQMLAVSKLTGCWLLTVLWPASAGQQLATLRTCAHCTIHTLVCLLDKQATGAGQRPQARPTRR